MLPATGSTITQAISSPRSANSASSAATSLNSTRMVSAVRPRGDARAVGQRQREHPAARSGEEGVGVAVVAADELDDLLAAGEAARDARGAHRRLGARVDHAHHLDGRDGLAHELRHLDLEGRRRAEAGAVLEDGAQPLQHAGMAEAQDHRPPRRDEVDELVAVGVPDVGALAARDEERVVHADALHRAHRRVHASGDVAQRLLEQPLGSLSVHVSSRSRAEHVTDGT